SPRFTTSTTTQTPTTCSPSLHAALPISRDLPEVHGQYPCLRQQAFRRGEIAAAVGIPGPIAWQHDEQEDRQPKQTGGKVCPANRSEEHTSELQSRENLVCRLLLEKKNSK